MLHNSAAKGATAFADATGFDLEYHCVDLFYWFHKSTKRKGILKEYYMFCDTEYEAVVKYVSVRWLCLERCLDRELKKYHALKSYFLSEHESDNRFKRLNELFQRPMSEIYLMFFQSSIALLTNFNRFLQREDPLIYLMHTQMETFLNKLAVKFIRLEKVMQHKEKFGTLKGLDISLENQKADASVTIGMVTKGRLRKFLDEGHIDIRDVDKFCCLLFIVLFAKNCTNQIKSNYLNFMARTPCKRSHRAYKEWAPSVR